MLRKHFEIAGWAAEHYQSLVVSASSERYPSQMVLWELCLSLKLQTLSSSTLCGDQWLILGRTLQSYANLKEKRCSSMSLLHFLSWWHCNNIGWVLRKETFKSLLLHILFPFIFPELEFSNIKDTGISYFYPATPISALTLVFSIGCTHTLFLHSLKSPEMCNQRVDKLLNRHLRMHGTVLLIKKSLGSIG